MRVLTDDETKLFFTKLAEYLGANIKFLIERQDETHVFRLIKDRVYYMSESLMKLSSNIGKDQLIQYHIFYPFFSK
jgi:60S ribosome subunit biogenesis protein NIP7